MRPRFDRKSLIPLLAVVCLAASCSHPSRTVAPALVPDGLSEAAPRGREANDAGRYLAGLPGTPGSAFADLEARPEWKLHRRLLDQDWGRIESASLPAMRTFQKKELSGAPIDGATVFYPFSGPDVLMATVFFPRNPVYVMVGLEPAGTLPTRKQFARADVGRRLAKVRDTVASELHRSFFITRQMDRQFRGQVTDGLFSPILQLLVRTNHTVLGYRYVRLDDEGRVIGRAANYHAPGMIGNKGVQIDYRADADGSMHRLFYFSVNLSDARLRDNRPFLAFLARREGMVSFFKATSYMTHKPEFSVIREQVLAHSAAVLQDDSGIPYRFFNQAAWQVRLYGGYDRPYGSFRWLQQPDLRQAYAAPGARALDFRIGYGFSRAPSNLQLASRRTAEARP